VATESPVGQISSGITRKNSQPKIKRGHEGNQEISKKLWKVNQPAKNYPWRKMEFPGSLNRW